MDKFLIMSPKVKKMGPATPSQKIIASRIERETQDQMSCYKIKCLIRPHCRKYCFKNKEKDKKAKRQKDKNSKILKDKKTKGKRQQRQQRQKTNKKEKKTKILKY